MITEAKRMFDERNPSELIRGLEGFDFLFLAAGSIIWYLIGMGDARYEYYTDLL